ncbi:cupin domain-containing protein [Caldicoprobacter algeriensis]|uniref:cupin domain-containing protein n=1 Tax=Caldicoprobacter algeriensis TaxID=699281 RepID=UPI00207AC54D|nr:cupin domain-containing protein [Caldicoprobacter algeriensis]MCM8901271.1 cupin domain-containing protein [Caldicoprobacter algeriensis]
MIEKKFVFQQVDDKVIEKIVDDENVNINHMILKKGDALPQHYSNSNVYMIVVRGNITVKLDDQDPHVYPAGTILNIPYNTKMNVYNQHDEVLEFFVVKVPSPRFYGRQ